MDTIASVPLAAPAEAGANDTVKVTLSLGVRDIGRLRPLSEKPEPETFAAEIVTADPPLLVNVSVRLALLLFSTLPKESLDEDAARLALLLEPPLGATPWQPASNPIPAATKRVLIQPRYEEKRKAQVLEC